MISDDQSCKMSFQSNLAAAFAALIPVFTGFMLLAITIACNSKRELNDSVDVYNTTYELPESPLTSENEQEERESDVRNEDENGEGNGEKGEKGDKDGKDDTRSETDKSETVSGIGGDSDYSEEDYAHENNEQSDEGIVDEEEFMMH